MLTVLGAKLGKLGRRRGRFDLRLRILVFLRQNYKSFVGHFFDGICVQITESQQGRVAPGD